MAGVSGCLKYSMFIFNFLFWLCGILILAVAIWVRVSKDGQELLSSGTDSYVSVNILIAVGAIIMILGFLGCCGAMKESRCMLLLFFIGLFLILLLQVAAGVIGAIYKPQSERILNETLYENVKLLSASDDIGKEFQKVLLKFQEEFKCCGLVHGAVDWGNNFQQNYKSCECSAPTDSCIPYEGKHVYKEPCISSIKDLAAKYIIVVIGIAFGLAVIEILGLVFSMVLYCQIGNK